MSKTETYTQCVLQNGASIQVSWVPTRYAVKEKKLKLRLASGEWENGWIVIRVYGTLPAAQVERDAHHRYGRQLEKTRA